MENEQQEPLRRRLQELEEKCRHLEKNLQEAHELNQSEIQYRTLVDNFLEGLVIIQNERIVFCNSAFADISGYTIEELKALPDTKSIIHPDDRQAIVQRYHERLSGKQVPRRYEYRIINKDGSFRWLEAYASRIEYNGASAAQIVQMDITKRKQAETSLKESEERFRFIAETIDEIIWLFDAEKGLATYINPAFDRIWGFRRELTIEDPDYFLSYIHPEDRKEVDFAVSCIEARKPFNYQYRIIRPDGTIRHLWSRGYPVEEAKGRPKRYIGVGQDITEWKKAEEALIESKEYFNQIINCIADPVFVKDRDHRHVLVNDAMCKFTGMNREELIGLNQFEGMPEQMVSYLWEHEEEVFKTGREDITEDTLKDSNNNDRIVMTKKSLLVDKSGHSQIIGVIRDITENKSLESQYRQAQKMEAVGVLAGGLAHDFNNLLNVINGYSELLMEDMEQNNPIRDDIEQIHKAGQRAATLTSQLLAFSRKQIIQAKPLNLNTVVSDMSTLLRRLIREDIEFLFAPDDDLRLIYADPVQIQQIIMNIAVNALDAMPSGGKFTIETANVDIDEAYIKKHPIVKKGLYAMLAISDNGTGMDEITRTRLFDPFYTTKERGKGTGLGLAMVYGIVKQNEGFIWVYSEPGKGTTFKIYFPCREGEAALKEADEKVQNSYQGSETVLIVEDETAVRTLARRILQDRGYKVLEAINGNEALNTARDYSDRIDLVVTDIVMPEMGGTKLVSDLKAERPEIKVLYISGYSDNAIIHNEILNSNTVFLQKPFTVENFARKVREVIES